MDKLTLKDVRKKQDLTQATVAEIMGVTIATVSAWETNKSDMPARKFAKICDIYRVSRDDILLPDVSN